MWVSGDFHDARIAENEPICNGIKVRFDSIWGCEIEITFIDEVEYHVGIRSPDAVDSYWYGAMF